MITAGVEVMPLDQRRSLLEKVRAFSTFSEDNDPHHEHDFGEFEEGGHKVFFKLDYYDAEMVYGSEDPADPSKSVSQPYNAANSGGSNLGPTSKALIDRVKADVDTLKQENPSEPVPARPRHHIRQRS